VEIIKEFDQQSDEWFLRRLGSIGGSTVAQAVAGGGGETRKTLMYRMVGEILSGQPADTYTSQAMISGIELEAEAREYYEMVTGNDVDQVAMVIHSPHKHYSPDGLVGDDKILECKCVFPSTHCKTINGGKIPSQYVKQVQWGLHCCSRDSVDFVSYCPAIKERPLFLVTVGRDEKLIRELDEGVDRFIEEMLAIVNKVRGVDF
jgi:putative phage-type endonuclease